MSGNVGARAVSDTGSTTGVATAILALLSAATMASISLVGAHQLALPGPEQLRAGAPAVVDAPVGVVVTPHVPAPSDVAVSHRHPTKTHRSSQITVVPAVLPARAPAPHKVVVAPATGDHKSTPHVPLPSIAPLPEPTAIVPAPIVTPPPPPPPPVPSPSATAGLPYPKLSPVPVPVVPNQHDATRQATTRVDAYQAARAAATAVLAEKTGRSDEDSTRCDQRAGRDHQGGYDGDRGRQDSGDHDRHGH